jgi:hypothetical protein
MVRWLCFCAYGKADHGGDIAEQSYSAHGSQEAKRERERERERKGPGS